jgi:hypothetical protein
LLPSHSFSFVIVVVNKVTTTSLLVSPIFYLFFG